MRFILGLIVDLILEGWFELMQFIVPDKMASRAFRSFLKVIVFIFTCVLYCSMFFGIIAMINPDEFVHKLGMYMFFVPLGISIVQILIGLIVNLKKKK